MKNPKPVELKLGLRPVFEAMIHSDAQEGPCRTGTKENLDPENEKLQAEQGFERFMEQVRANVRSDAALLDPVKISYGEDFTVSEKQFKKLQAGLKNVDLFLLSYRVPGIEKLGKPVAMIGGGISNVDVSAYMRSRGYEGFAPLDYDELNELISLLRVRKAVSKTRIMAIEHPKPTTFGVVSSIWDFDALKKRYGVGFKSVSFNKFYKAMDEVESEKADELARRLIENADQNHMSDDDVVNSVIPYLAAKKLLKRHSCNAFTFPCFEACSSKIPAQRRFVPCLTHTLLKDQGIPSACEGDISVLMAMAILMYVSRKSVYMGNPSIENRDGNILKLVHDVPGLKMMGLDDLSLPYEIRNFTNGGWGVTIRYDFAREMGKKVTLARFDPSGERLLAVKGEIVGGTGFDQISCTLGAHILVRDVAGLIHAQADFGHHLAMAFGDYAPTLTKLGKLMNFEVVEA